MKTSSMCVLSSRGARAVVCSLVVACGHEAKPPVTTTAAIVAPARRLAPASPGKSNSSIYLSDRLRELCNIATIESVTEAPKFDFDRSELLAEDRDVLARVAQCLTTGPLKGRAIQLVGRADPRGTQEYNMALGERRSGSTMQYLQGLGVSLPQMSETSRGALDATGTDEATWRLDRRVDIDISDGTR